ncbi:MAG: hypothetical protein Q9174_004553 [Haloplaca sp. 1 TL-2023]
MGEPFREMQDPSEERFNPPSTHVRSVMNEENENDSEDAELPSLDQLIQAHSPSPSPPKKRPRVSTPSALNKPFKTPLRTSSKFAQIPSTPQLSLQNGSSQSSTTPSLTPPNSSLETPARPPRRLCKSYGRDSPTKTSHGLDQLKKRHTALLNELSSLRANVETTNQALEIESSDTDAELEALIRKWKLVSRDAADGVFSIMKQKVDAMGGLKAWRKAEKERVEGLGRYHDEEKVPRDNEDDDEEGPTKKRRWACEDGDRSDGQDEEESEEFTMEMMLKSLGIPLEKLGYDKVLENWIED